MVKTQLASRISESRSGQLTFLTPVPAFVMNTVSAAHLYLHTDYTFASPTNDGLASFNIDNAPSYLFSTIKDIQSVNPAIKVHLLPWSPVSMYLSIFEMLRCLFLPFSPRG